MKIKKDVEKVFYKQGEIFEYTFIDYEDSFTSYYKVLKDFEKVEQYKKHIDERLIEWHKDAKQDTYGDYVDGMFFEQYIDYISYLIKNSFVESYNPATTQNKMIETNDYQNYSEIPYIELEESDFRVSDNSLSIILKKCMEDDWGGEHEYGLKRSIDNINRFLNLGINLSGADFTATNDGQLEFEYKLLNKEYLIIRINWLGLVYTSKESGSMDFKKLTDNEIKEQFEKLLVKEGLGNDN